MPSEKSHRVSIRKAAQNQSVRSATRTMRRNAVAATQAGSEATDRAVIRAVGQLDRAARKGIVHPNKAARHKSQLMRALNAAKTPKA
ncbi:MAG: 30S ribosomal protein S20 [SAR202 cluster bacterium]|nr:30S ribosomal protein S20 [SAR202 cluster bacterium]